MKDLKSERALNGKSDDHSVVVLTIPQTLQEQFGGFYRGADEKQITKDTVGQQRTQSQQNRQVQLEIRESELAVRIIGDNRPRRIHAISLGTINCLVDEEEMGGLETVTRSFGEDSLGFFKLNPDLPSPPAVYVEWEQAIQMAVLGIDPADHQDVIKPFLPDDDFDKNAFFDFLVDNKNCEQSRAPKSAPVKLPKTVKGAWRKLYDWLFLDPTCKCCSKKDLAAEALAIVLSAMRAKPWAKGKGCIASSLTLLNSLVAGLGKHIISVKSGTVQGVNVFGTTTTRTWMKIETHCYIIENVAWWYGFFRHQAVLVYPKCDKQGFMNPTATVIDLWGPAGKVWQSWSAWAGGMGEVNKTAGRVRDKF